MTWNPASLLSLRFAAFECAGIAAHPVLLPTHVVDGDAPSET